MEILNWQRIQGRLQHYSRLMGWQGVIGSMCLFASLIFLLAMVIPKARNIERLAQDVAKLRKEMPQHQGRWIDRSPQASLNTFYQFLPTEREATALLSVILASASDNGLVLDKADYALTRNSQAAFSRYQITMPVSGSYVQIRRFSNQVLNALPAAALNEISFKRQDIGTEKVEAKLRFTVYLRRGKQ
ncbi:MAG: type 4a pilus biogenesis protein PilO [Methylophilaceae bacterium]